MLALLPIALLASAPDGRTQEPVPDARSDGVGTITQPAIASELLRLHSQDQNMIRAVYKVQADPRYKATFDALSTQVRTEQKLDNFFDTPLKVAWVARGDAPEAVRNYLAWRRSTDARIRQIVTSSGWPGRREVGDEAAASFLFLFGHADELNDWRLKQVPSLERMLRRDQLNPQMYAHLRDRLAVLDHKPQIFGTVMGPGREPGSAKLYAPLADSEAVTDRRRVEIGLPPMETNLTKFRNGARISSYMTPVMPSETLPLSAVFTGPL